MPLKLLLVLGFLIAKPISTYGKILIIDTISGYDANIAFLLPSYRYGFDEHEDSILTIAERNLHIDHHPALVADIGNIQNFELLLDSKGGRLEFLNMDKISSDTIRISKWVVFKNGINDTTINVREVWGKRGENYQPPISVKVKKKVIRHKGLKQLSNITLNFNGNIYDITIVTSSAIVVTSYSGYAPKSKCYNGKGEPTHERESCNYFSGEIRTNTPRWSGTISF